MTTDLVTIPTTLLAIVLDRSGSMQSIREDTIGGFNAFLAEQRAQHGRTLVHFLQFNDECIVLEDMTPIERVADLTSQTFLPGGSTALFDGIGKAIRHVEQYIASAKPLDRPSTVVFLILTDGHENASRSFDQRTIQKLIDTHHKYHGWVFIFLGTSIEMVESASQDLGIDPAQTVVFRGEEVGETLRSVSRSVSAVRTGGSLALSSLQGSSNPKGKMN